MLAAALATTLLTGFQGPPARFGVPGEQGSNAPATSTPALDLYKKWRGGATSMRAQYRFRPGPSGIYGTATLEFAPGRAHLNAKYMGQHYEMTVLDGKVTELGHNWRIYNNFEIQKGAVRFPSDFSSLPQMGFASELLPTNLLVLFPPGTKPKDAKENGNLVTTLDADLGMTQISIRFEFAPNGEPKKLQQILTSPDGREFREFVIDKIELNPPLTVANFTLKTPSDYSPWAMPVQRLGYDIGEKFPFSDWKGAKAPTKPTIAVGALKGDKRLEGALKLARELGIPVVQLREPGESGDGWQASSPAAWKGALGAGSPIFFLFDGKGVLQHAWLGYTERIHEARKKEMLAKLKEL